MSGQFDDIFGIDTTDENNTSNTNGSFDDVFGVNTQAKSDVPSRGLGGFLKDTAIDVTKGAVGLGEAAVGLADIPTGNLVGRGLASIGYDPKATREILDSGYSEGRQLANKNVEEASGFVDTAKALVENPSAAFGAVAESSPMSLGGAGVARNVAQRLLAGSGIKAGTAAATEFLKRPDVMAKIIGAGAASEGAMTTGSIQEQGRQGGRDWADTILPAAAAGVGTAAIGVLSSKVPGFKDAEASFAKAGLVSGEKTSLLSAGKEIAKTMFKEGVLEEMPQSGQEQVFTNFAMGNPWDAGVPEAMAQGMVVGALQGGGMETSSKGINALNANKDQGIKDRAQEEINKAIFNRSITLLNQDRPGIDKSVQEINSTIEANNELLNDPQKFTDKVKELNIDPETFISQITRNNDMNKGLIERINISLAEQDKVSQSNGNKAVSAEIPTWDTLPKGQNVTLYRGENNENTPDGEWWTTDKTKAEKYGAVTEVSLPAETVGQHAAMGHGGSDEFVFPTEGARPIQLANNIDQESLRRDQGWAKSTPVVEDSELLDYVKQTQASLEYRQQQNAPKLIDPNIAISEAAKVEQAKITAEMDQLVNAYRTGNINGWVNNPENVSQDGQGLLSEVQQRQASLEYNKNRNLSGQPAQGQLVPVQSPISVQQPMTGWAADKRSDINNRFTGNEIDRLSATYNPEIPGSEINRLFTTSNPEIPGSENGWINNKQTTPEDKSAEPQQKRKGLQQSLLNILNDRQKSLNNEARKDLINSVFNNEQPGETPVDTQQNNSDATQTVEEADLNKIKLKQYAKEFKALYSAGHIDAGNYMGIQNLLGSRNIEAIEQVLNEVNKQIEEEENGAVFARTASFKARGKADLRRLIDMLGSQMYKGNMADVVIKETVQNSFDAVNAALGDKGAKGIKEGQIDIISDPGNRIVAIRDNGQGMTKETILNAFLTIAGSDKPGLEQGGAAGRYGMAKIVFLNDSEWVELRTVKDGKRYSFRANGNEIFADKDIIINTEKAEKNDHGTVLVIKIPREASTENGLQPVWFPNNIDDVSFFKQPLLSSNIVINYNDKILSPGELENLTHSDSSAWNKENFQTVPIGKNADMSKYDNPVKITFDWGRAELYIGKERIQRAYNAKHNVLSAGVYQFDHAFNIKEGEKVPYDIILSVFPNADAKDPSYPINMQREGWRSTVYEDIKSLNAYVKNLALGIEAQGTVDQFKNIKSLPRIDINDIGTSDVDISDFFKPKKKPTEGKKSVVPPTPSSITVKDGQVLGVSDKGVETLLINHKDSKKIKSSFSSEKEAPKAKDFLIDIGIDDNQPIFHNNTTSNYFEIAKQHGYSAETFFAEFGSLLLEVKDIFVDKSIWGYDVLKDKDQSFFFGTSIDKGYHGVNLVVPFKTILVNPLAMKTRGLPGIVHGLYDTIVHEFAHIPQRNHEKFFSEEVAKLKTELASDGSDLEIRSAIHRLIKKHKNLIELLRDEYESSATKNAAKSLNSTDKSDALASRRNSNGSERGIETGNGEWPGAINSGERSTEDDRVQTGNQIDGRDVTFKPVDITSKNFKRWFAGSQVKDENGNPLRVYHGSTTFGINKDDQWAFAQNELGKNKQSPLTGLGHFFATDMTESLGYTGGGTGALHTVYLNIKNPVEINSWEFPAFNTPAEARAFAKMKEASGYDGFFIKDQGHYVAFNPGQIKSGEVNTGEFDPNNPDIRFQTTEQADLNKINLEDIKKAFSNQEVIQDTNGSISVRFKNGQGLTIKSIQTAGQGFVKIAIETGQMSKTGKILGITIDNEILLDENFADNKTLWHENKHVLDNLGMITADDDVTLNREFNKLRKSGKLEFAISTHEDPKQRMVENRANMFAQIMVNRESYRNTPLGKVIQRIMDFFQQMLAFGKQTVSGLARDAESGKIYERKINGQNLQTIVPQTETTADKWYSVLENTVNNFQQKQATPNQWKGMIKNFPGIKAEELEWMGLNEWLDDHTGKVTKDSLINFIRENNVQLEEVIKKPNDVYIKQLNDQLNLLGYAYESDYDQWALRELNTYDLIDEEDYPENVKQIIDNAKNAISEKALSKYEKYQLPGGEDYTELLLTIPIVKDGHFVDTYNSSHWDEPNILAHIRFDERTDSEGSKVLFIEEIQSDWHQAGRGEGYQGDKGITKKQFGISIGGIEPNIFFDSAEEAQQRIDNIRNNFIGETLKIVQVERVARDGAKSNSVPNAPFKKSWPLLAMKRMIRHAAENGFDKIAWTTGQQQADRYQGGTEEDRAKRLAGMKGFYDQMLPSILNKEFNRGKWGNAGVEVVEIPHSEFNSLTGKYYQDGYTTEPLKQLSLPITERMRSKALREGMAMFEVREVAEQKIPQADYDALKTEQNNLLQSYAQQARIKFHEMKLLADKALGSISTRLKNVDPELSEHLRWLDFKTSQKIIGVLKTAEPILDITNGAKNALGIRQGGMTADDKIEWNWARLNSDEGKIELLAKKYNLTEHLANLREKLNEIRSEAIEVGYDVGFIDEYWPRVIKDQEGFLQATQEISQRPVFTEAIRAQAKKLGISQEQFERDFPEVKADIISNLILGRTSGIGGPGNIHSRVFETIDKKYAPFYMDADASLMQYVYSMTKKIEARKFFGKVPQKISALKTSKKQKQAELIKFNMLADMARAENPEKLIDIEDRITQLNEDIARIDEPLNEYKFTNDYTENIGSYIDQMMIDGRIEKKDEKMVSDILDARFHEQGTHGIVNAYKNAAYIDTMGSPMSAITQIGDLAWAMYVGKVWTPSGLLGTGKNLRKAIVGKSDITKEDLGIERIAQEFADGTTLSRAVSKVFKIVGLEKMDSIGKEVLINNALDQFKAQAKADPKALERLIKPIFKDKSSDVVQEILAYDPIKNPTINPSDNIKMLLYSKLLDFQPVALSEMPEMYLKGGNGRVFYMLKTYTLKQFDVLRREVAHNLKSTDSKQQLQGMINLIQLMALLTLANAGADELKDLLLGKESKFSDRVIENILTMGGASRYTRMQVTKDGIGSAAAQQILPPMKFLNAASKDANESYNNYVSGDVSKFDHARIIDSIPVVGKLYYWHYGRGTDNKQSIAEQEFKKASTDARLFKKQLENSQDKKVFLQSNIDRFKQSKLQENFQAALNRNKEVMNKLEKIPSTENVQTRLGQLKAQREQLMQRYLDVAKSMQ